MSPKVITRQLYDDLKDSLNAAQVTIADLQQQRSDAAKIFDEGAERRDQRIAALERDVAHCEQQREKDRAQIGVLQSDRDRLTAALEVVTRRLASPAAETVPSRAGWRAANEANARSSTKMSGREIHDFLNARSESRG